MKTLFDLDLAKKNNFDAIRFVAASLVIFSHAFAVGGQPGAEPLAGVTGFIHFGALAVEIFFVVSGYLIIKSALSRSSLLDFVEARILRIFPALIVCCLVSALVLGFLVTSLPKSDYLTDNQTWAYLFGNASMVSLQWFLPGVFAQNPLKGVVNGSLWTLPIELKMYGVILVLGLLTLVLKRYRTALLALSIAGYLVYCFATPGNDLGNHVSAAPGPLNVLFLVGSLLYLVRKLVPISATLAMATWVGMLFVRGTPAAVPLYYLALGYSILVIAFDENLPLHNFAKYGDFSYGLYLYGFPVKQTIASFTTAWTPNMLFLAAFPITLCLAWLSWRTIEKPALGKKGYVAKRLGALRNTGAKLR